MLNFGGKYQISDRNRKIVAEKLGIQNPSWKDFKSNPELQEKMFSELVDIQIKGLKTQKFYGATSRSEKIKLLAAEHLIGRGKLGAPWFRDYKKGKLNPDIKDGNGMPALNYYYKIGNELFGETNTLLNKRSETLQEITQKEVKQMSKKQITKLVTEMLNENSGQGYSNYPYGNMHNEQEPTEDYVKEWKALSVELIRDESRTTAVEIAKILIKDLELFEDVLDLAGQNQSVGTEILDKLKKVKSKEMT